jgi:cysteine-rich repeat protein
VANYYLGSDPAAPNAWSSYTIDITSDVVPGQSYVLRFADTGNQFLLNQGVDNVSIVATVPSAVEQCDDGNNVGGDSCSADCIPCSTAPFVQTVIALADKETFRWGSPVDLFYAVGDLDQVGSYAPTVTGSIPHVTQIQLTQIPDSGKGIYFVARIHCPSASWSSLGSGQCCTRTLP